MNVELAALPARRRRRLELEDGGGDPVDVEDPREGQAAEARADDRDANMFGHEANMFVTSAFVKDMFVRFAPGGVMVPSWNEEPSAAGSAPRSRR